MEPRANGTPQRPRARRLNSSRHEKIVEAAVNEFLTCGYLGASLDDIARKAEVAKPTIYSYFGGKEELFYEVIRISVFQASFQVSRVLGGFNIEATNLREALIDVCRSMFVVLTSSPNLELRKLIITEIARPNGLIWLPDDLRTHSGLVSDQQARLWPTRREAVNLVIQPGFEAAAGLMERIMATRSSANTKAAGQGQIPHRPGQMARHFLSLTLSDVLQRSVVSNVPNHHLEQALAAGVDAFFKISGVPEDSPPIGTTATPSTVISTANVDPPTELSGSAKPPSG